MKEKSTTRKDSINTSLRIEAFALFRDQCGQ